ncbi:acyl-CoA dehydrogenase [Nocardioides marmoriginsengisoli]|uniref:Acyl-CoA dehydrogenase n=1 Tax=Nocardioides marmoriginsengisoli TaxID=661483 RepID=A0A3N0CH55_9ACTN|nr:acyl-CoA dehydrogenase family protein [Nocardioides marmoriginsengisoli]RNL62768.1 acyl-CoA dehydrogenase [Nocardioides marmoriginsengisoli]
MELLLDEDNKSFRDSVRSWVDDKYTNERARQLEADDVNYPQELWEDFADAGFHGIGIGEEYGGQGGDVISQIVLGQGLARRLGGLVAVWGIPSFAGGKSIGAYGTEEQKQRFLPDLAKGKLRFAIAITEPAGGTDVLGAMRTRATKVDGGWTISGQKVWSTGAHVADYLLVLAVTDPEEKPSRRTTCFLVPTTNNGLTMRKIPKIGMRAVASNEVYFDDVFVPDDLVLGEIGRGWANIVATLNNERILTASFATGMIEGVLEGSLEYLKVREAFGGPIGRFQALQHYVADISSWLQQSELITYYAALLQQQGQPCAKEATMAKMVTAEYVSKASDLGIQILGGMGMAQETDMQRFWRDSRLFQIAPITNEMARNMIAESYGLPRSY